MLAVAKVIGGMPNFAAEFCPSAGVMHGCCEGMEGWLPAVPFRAHQLVPNFAVLTARKGIG
jgi:hypothetical protein